VETDARLATRTTSGFGRVCAVAWRDFAHTALTKAFLFGAIGVPVMVAVVLAFMPKLMEGGKAPIRGSVAVYDPSGKVAPLIARMLDEEAKQQEAMLAAMAATSPSAAPTTNTPSAAPTTNTSDAAPTTNTSDAAPTTSSPGAPATPSGTPPPTRPSRGGDMIVSPLILSVETVANQAEIPAQIERLGAGGLVALVQVPPELLASPPPPKWPPITLTVRPDSPATLSTHLDDYLRAAVMEARLAAYGIDPADAGRVMLRPAVDSQRVARGGAVKKESIVTRMFVPIGFMMLVWIGVFTSGNYLLTTTIEEKSSRVMEVLLSAVSPMQLLAGKLLGQGLVSLVMLVTYAGAAITALSFFALADVVPLSLYLYGIVYFVIAYFMVGTLMVAVGSAVSELREAQSLITPAMILIMIPLWLWFPISNAPNGVLATVSGFIPPALPFVMVLRLASGEEPVPTWQIALSLLIGVGGTIAMLWAAARIFRVGILMQGKPPSVRELLRWVTVR